MMQHYKYGGSTAARTIACPAWLGLSADMPKQTTSSFAEIGSMLHDCMERILIQGNTPDDYLGHKYGEYEVNAEHIISKLHPAHDGFKQLCKDYKLEEYEAETTMERSSEIGGTADFIGIGKNVVVVGDWKFGDGIAVSPDHSAQGLFYAMLARDDMPDLFDGRSRLVIAIIQPSNRGEPTVKTWETNIAYLDCFEAEFMNAVEETKKETVKPKTGEHCKWCPATPICPAKTGLVLQAQRLNATQKSTVSEALSVAAELDAWIKDVRAFAHDQMELGVKFKGWKLVQKRAYTKWHDEESAMDIARKAKKLTIDECSTTTMLSPAKLKTLCKKKGIDFDRFDGYCSATSSGTTIAISSDKRSEYIAGGAIKALKDRLG